MLGTQALLREEMKEKEFYKDQYKMFVQQNAEMEERLNK